MTLTFDTDTDDLCQEIQDFLTDALNTLLDGEVQCVTDDDELVPQECNNFLLSEDGTEFAGLIHLWDSAETVPFRMFEEDGSWSLECSLLCDR